MDNQKLPKKRSTGRAVSRFFKTIWKVFKYLFIFLSIIAILALIGVISLAYYSSYQFEEQIGKSGCNYRFAEFKSDAQSRKTFDEKVIKYNGSSEQLDFIELTTQEVGVILSESLEDGLPEYYTLEDLCIRSGEGSWRVAMKYSVGAVPAPWIEIDINKDSIESAELYISSIRVGEVELDAIGLSFVKHDLNRVYYEMLSAINLSGIVTRQFINIELESEGIVIKGSK